MKIIDYLDSIIGYLNSLGCISNIFTIGSPLFIFLLFVSKKPRNWIIRNFKKTKSSIRYHSIYEFIQKNFYTQKESINPKDLKILILDDELGNYPIEYLNDSNYNIDSKEKISLSKIDDLLKYHIIILDITGIVEEDLKQGGFELLKRLKHKKPYGQAIIAASSKRFDMSVADFYKLADKKIKTPIEAIEIEDVFDEVANLKFSINDISKYVDGLISKVTNQFLREEFTSLSILFLQNECSLAELQEKLSLHLHKDEINEFIFNIRSLKSQIENGQNNRNIY